AGLRALTSDNAATPPPTVDWQLSFRAARDDGRLQVLAPRSLPSGWKPTSVSFTPGSQPVWHLGLLTSGAKYVGIDESRDDLLDLVHDKVDENAATGAPVTIAGSRWQVFTDSGGDYALGRTVTHAGEHEAQLVGGSAPPATVRAFAATLEPRS
ncbi:MAG: DUF4245 family protein, partial [Marmoricola sp.]|nr:DUF4245 family protein [Marmoricola sp.]